MAIGITQLRYAENDQADSERPPKIRQEVTEC